MLDFDGTRKARQRDVAIAGAVLLAGLILLFLPPAFQEPIRTALRNTVLKPFLMAQEQIATRRARSFDVSELRAQRDSLSALVAAQATLAEENRKLREMNGLRARSGSAFRPAEVLRVGVPGAESTFFINIGRAEGVEVNAPVLAPGGLLGRVIVVDEHMAQVMDWTHPEFRASAMTADGEAYGLVEARRGRFREEDLLALTGAPFHLDIQPGRSVVTSGRGGIYPRGIPLGTVIGIEEADTGWRKSYLLRPAARPEGASHVLVGMTGANVDHSRLFNTAVADSTRRVVARPPGDTSATRRAQGGAAPTRDTTTTDTTGAGVR